MFYIKVSPLLSRNTNKMQLCNRIYYTKVYWRLNMFRAAHRSSSGALKSICSLWFVYTCSDRPLSRLNESVEITNKMQPCIRIYYSRVYWRLNMFRAAHRSSSGALNCICSLWFVYTCGDQPLSRLNESVEITKKMQPCNRIYYSKVYWRLNKFRGGYRSSSGALNCMHSFWFIYPCGDGSLLKLSGKKIRPYVFSN